MAMNDEASTTNVNFPQGMNPWNMFGSGKGMSGSALGIGIAGLVAGGLALLGARLGNGLGGNGCGPQYATTRDLDYERELTERDAKIGKLESQLYTDQQVNALRQEQTTAAAAQSVFDAKLAGALDIVRNKVALLDGMMEPVLKPQVLAPSQAVLTQFQNAVAAKTSASGESGGNS